MERTPTPAPDGASVRRLVVDRLPRIPFEVSIDLTYRCNNSCRHCWLWLPADSTEQLDELSFNDWRQVVDQARSLGTQRWMISGGEPMLRPDFEEIFDYVTGRATSYTLNTNGTRVTPTIARLMKREGAKLVAVYGATAEVYDHVTRNPGGFEALLQGIAYLREARADFIVQLIPMRANWSQWRQMVDFAQSICDRYRVGAPWLWKSACGSDSRNDEIERQRLAPASALVLDPPGVSRPTSTVAQPSPGDDRLYAACVTEARGFHVDPYGSVSFCSMVKDSAMRRLLRQKTEGRVREGALRDIWEGFIPGIPDLARGGQEYSEGCGVCDIRDHCRWCDAYGYLETGRHGAKVDYLCSLARAASALAQDWSAEHVRFYEIAGITLQVESDLPITDATFDDKLRQFQVAGRADDAVTIRHHFGLPDLEGHELGVEIYRRPPWAIYRKGQSWIYLMISPDPDEPQPYRVAVFDHSHVSGALYSDELRTDAYLRGGLGSLTMFPSDQILVARLLADREGCLLHSGGVAIDGQGLLFVGHSDAGKSTTITLVRRELGERAEILCDDRNAVRFWSGGYRGGPSGCYVHGTWSHGDVSDVSSSGVPLRGILFLEQSEANELVMLTNRKQIWRRLLATLVKPLVTADWWTKEMDVLERIVAEVPCYRMRFDRSGRIVAELERLVS